MYDRAKNKSKYSVLNGYTYDKQLSDDLNKFYLRFEGNDLHERKNYMLELLKNNHVFDIDVSTILKPLKQTNKCTGPNNITSQVLKYCAYTQQQLRGKDIFTDAANCS